MRTYVGIAKRTSFLCQLDAAEIQPATFTWRNVSGLDRNSALLAIKPSGINYETLKIEDIVIVDLDGKVVEGKLRPSSDTLTHLQFYKAFPHIGGVVH
jgi:L-ribulose-5-phosphate 4-epimerase